MRLASRLRDATRSPVRLWWLGMRAVGLALRGEMPAMLARLRPAAPDAQAYRACVARQAAPVPARQPAIGEVRLDVTQPAVAGRLAVQLGGLLGDAAVLARDGKGWRPVAMQAARDGRWTLLVSGDVLFDAGALVRFEVALASLSHAVAAYADFDHRDAQGRPERPMLLSAWDAEQAFERVYCGSLLALRDGAVLDAALSAPPGESLSAAVAALAAMPDPVVAHVPEVVCAVLGEVGDDRHGERGADAARRRGASVAGIAGAPPTLRFAVPPGLAASVIVPTRDHATLLRACLDSVPARLGDVAVEIVVVDNGSTEPALAALCDELVRTRAARIVEQPIAFNFAALCNAGAGAARGDVLVFLNNDARFADAGALEELVSLAVRPWTGAVGPWLWYEDGRVQSAGVLAGVNRTATSALAGFAATDAAVREWSVSRRRVSAVMGACLAVERGKFAAVGGFDDAFAVSHNEVDLCLRLERAGLANVVTPHARVVHAEGATRGYEVSPAERARLDDEERRFTERWRRVLAVVDPAHHPWRSRRGNPFAFTSGTIDRSPRLGWHARHG